MLALKDTMRRCAIRKVNGQWAFFIFTSTGKTLSEPVPTFEAAVQWVRACFAEVRRAGVS